MINGLEYLLIGLAAMAAGITNALAGGGTLITFPTLVAVGIPAISANVTNTVALCPGFLGGTLAQLKDLRGQRQRLLWILPICVLGGLLGGFLLLQTGEKLFRVVVPYLILMSALLLAVQNPMRNWLTQRLDQNRADTSHERWVGLPVGVASVYGGYFGPGLSVIVLAILGFFLDDNLTRMNALKQAIAFSTNIAAACYFLFSGKVIWSVALVMAGGALLGGSLGGRLAGRVKPGTLRWIVVVIGIMVGILYLVRG